MLYVQVFLCCRLQDKFPFRDNKVKAEAEVKQLSLFCSGWDNTLDILKRKSSLAVKQPEGSILQVMNM